MGPQTTLRPTLPAALLEKLEINTGSARGSGSRYSNGKHANRKDARKQERMDKKSRRAQHRTPGAPQFSTTAPPHNGKKRPAPSAHLDEPTRKKSRTSDGKPVPDRAPVRSTQRSDEKTPATRRPHVIEVAPPPQRRGQRSIPPKPTIKGGKTEAPPSLRTRQEQEEDAYIAHLESKLGWRKGGRKTKSFGSGLDNDGLDDLLEGLDDLGRHDASSDVEQDVNDSDESADDFDDEEDDSADSDEAPQLLDSDDSSGNEDAFSEEEDEWAGITFAETHYGTSSNNEITVEASEPSAGPTTRYIPPHLRKRAEPADNESSEELQKLQKQVKGLMNRLSEQNIAVVLDSIEEMYRKHRRHDVSSTLAKIVIDGVSSHALLLDSYVALHAAFVASLYKIVGTDFGALFVQTIVNLFEQHHHSVLDSSPSLEEGQESAPGKEASNLLVLLCELYNFQVVSCVLIYDIVRVLLGAPTSHTGINEFDVELLLKIVRSSGQQLRQDDPSSLKDIVQLVQIKVSDNQDTLSSRTRFMLETLSNLKNNKIKKKSVGNAGQSGGAEAVDRLKKFLSGLEKKKHVLAHEPLRVSLDDLHSAESKGKWWLVGAAWGGDPLVDRREQRDQQGNGANEQMGSTPAPEITENALVKLAKKQGMNTDIRRSIFVVLMSSDDYVDACERLAQLNLKEVQQREVIRVLLHCCGNEKSYNPYYTLVAQHLCSMSHSYKITLQFCLWDFLREMGETSVGGAEVIKNIDTDGDAFDGRKMTERRMRNVARAYAWWVAKGALTLSILKPVDFTTLKSTTRTFLTAFFSQVIISSQIATPVIASGSIALDARKRGAVEEIFVKAARISTLAMGIVYFLGLVQKDGKVDPGADAALIEWGFGVARDTLRAAIDVVPDL